MTLAAVTRFSPDRADAALLTYTAREGRALHVVQVSIDWHILAPERDPEPLARQRDYVAELRRLRPGSQMTIVIVVPPPLWSQGYLAKAKSLSSDGLHLEPVCASPLGSLVAIFRHLVELSSKHPIDVLTSQRVFNEGWSALCAARFLDVPIVGQIHFDMFAAGARAEISDRGLLRRLRSLITTRVAIPKFTAIRVDGSRVGEELKRRGLINRYEQIPVPSPLVRRSKEETGKRLSLVDEPRVIFVGRLARQKRLDRWLRVAAAVLKQVPEAHFEIVGDGPLRSELETLARQLQISDRVVFTGEIPNAEIPSRLRQSRVFLLTSDYEGLARVLLEAMAAGVPVVSTAIGGSEDIIENEVSGFIAQDEHSLCDAVVTLLRDRSRATAIAQRGWEIATTQFSYESIVERWAALLVSSAKSLEPRVRSMKELSWRRFLYFFQSPLSLTRAAQYESVAETKLSGRILDLGGGRCPEYLPLLKNIEHYESVNIFPKAEPTYLHDLNKPLPLEDESFDCVLSLNTFEHLSQDELALSEAVRVLKPGGRLVITVPFLYPIHGSPSDFSRHTPFWWIERLEQLQCDSVFVEALGWSRLASLLSLAGNSWKWRVLRHTVMFVQLCTHLLRRSVVQFGMSVLLGARVARERVVDLAGRSHDGDMRFATALLICAVKPASNDRMKMNQGR